MLPFMSPAVIILFASVATSCLGFCCFISGLFEVAVMSSDCIKYELYTMIFFVVVVGAKFKIV